MCYRQRRPLANPPRVRLPSPSPLALMPPRTVLVVEDHPDNRLICTALLEHSGYRVLQAENGEVGVRIARSHRPSVILMDLAMPVMDGLEAAQTLKSDPATVGIPIVAVTAYDNPVREGLFVDVLRKPIGADRLLGAVVTALGTFKSSQDEGTGEGGAGSRPRA